jgi:small-conductance mechanosensitive channel
MPVPTQVVLPLLIAQDDQQVVSESTSTGDWVLAAVVLVGSVIVALITKRLVASAVEGAGVEERVARAVGRWTSYLIVLAGVVAFLIILGVQIGPLLTAFAAIGVAVTFAIQDDLRNMWSGMQIQTRRPYSLGDQISTGEWTGTVEAIKLRSTTLRTPDGKQVVVPSGNIMLRGIDNLSAEPVRRTTLRVGVAYETDLERAQRLLVDAVRGVEEVDSSKDPEALVEKLGPTGVTFAVRFWHGAATSEMWSARSASAIAVKSALEEAGIKAPTLEQVVWLRQGAGPSTDGGSKRH